MIQDIYPAVFNNEFSRKREPEAGDTVFAFDSVTKSVLVRETREKGDSHLPCSIDGAPVADRPVLEFPTAGEVIAATETNDYNGMPWSDSQGETSPFAVKLVYLFEIDGKAMFLAMPVKPMPPEVPGFSYLPLRTVRRANPRNLCFAAETAYQLYLWYRSNRFCGKCGDEMRPGENERSMICLQCGNVVYPKISPAVIVGVTNGDSILMTRYAGREYKGHALIAGFCEIGESGEDTVRREVMEEAGVRVRNIRYYKSQPWGFDSDLLIGYYCDLEGSDAITMQEDELDLAEWVPRPEITDVFEDMSLTNEMIVNFRDGHVLPQ